MCFLPDSDRIFAFSSNRSSLIGMIADPYGLGVVDDVELINLLAELGIIILVFVVGLEFRLQKLCKAGIKPIVVGMSELLIMFFLAYVGAFSFD